MKVEGATIQQQPKKSIVRISTRQIYSIPEAVKIPISILRPSRKLPEDNRVSEIFLLATTILPLSPVKFGR